jgi:tetratricopeptide (TPR) repeat protein
LGSIYGDLGHEALDERRTTEAIRYFKEASALDPASKDHKSGLGRAYMDDSRWWLMRGLEDKAFEKLNAAKSYAPLSDEDLTEDLAAAFYDLGRRYDHDDRLDWAISSYKRAYELNDGNLTYRGKLAESYSAKGDEHFAAAEYQDAETQYQLALDLYKGSETYADLVQSAQDAQAV